MDHPAVGIRVLIRDFQRERRARLLQVGLAGSRTATTRLFGFHDSAVDDFQPEAHLHGLAIVLHHDDAADFLQHRIGRDDPEVGGPGTGRFPQALPRLHPGNVFDKPDIAGEQHPGRIVGHDSRQVGVRQFEQRRPVQPRIGRLRHAGEQEYRHRSDPPLEIQPVQDLLPFFEMRAPAANAGAVPQRVGTPVAGAVTGKSAMRGPPPCAAVRGLILPPL